MFGRYEEFKKRIKRRQILLSCILTVICVIMSLYIVIITLTEK